MVHARGEVQLNVMTTSVARAEEPLLGLFTGCFPVFPAPPTGLCRGVERRVTLCVCVWMIVRLDYDWTTGGCRETGKLESETGKLETASPVSLHTSLTPVSLQ